MIENGTVIDGRYVVERTLASGGMGTVLVVRHQTLDSLHALKVLHVTGRDLQQRLITEGRVQARLGHPNIVAVTDTLMVGEAPGIVMEYVDGGSLDDLMEERELSVEEIERLFLGILAGVQHAHDQGLVHRDLKPANVLIARYGDGGLFPKVTDFGIVKVLEDVGGDVAHARTRTGIGMGTPQYMAPEQADGANRVGPESDVFSLGVILYELVCGQRPFESHSILGILSAANEGLYDDPEDVRPGLPDRVYEAIRGALVPEREERIRSCTDLAVVLTAGRVRSLSNLNGATNPGPSTFPPIPRYPRGLGSIDKHGGSRRRRTTSPGAVPPTPTRQSRSQTPAPVRRPPEPESVFVDEPSGGGRTWILLGGVAVVVVLLVGGATLALGVGAAGAAAWFGMGTNAATDSGPVDLETGDTDAGGETDDEDTDDEDTDDTDVGSTGTNGGGSSTSGKNGGGTNTSTGGTNTSTGGTSTSTGGTSTSTGGTSTNTGGTSANTGGTSTNSGGTSTNSGGTSTNTGGTSANTGGTSANTGGTTSTASADWTLKVTGHRTAPSSRSLMEYKARNGHLVLVDFVVTNQSGRAVDALAPWSLASGGRTYEATVACKMAVKGGQHAVELDDGDSARGTVCFDVPKSVTGGELRFSPRMGSQPAARARF